MRRIGFPNLEGAGRLGNQLWQIASTLGFARRGNLEPVFPESWSYRPYFSLPDHWYDDKALRRAVDAVRLSNLPGIQKHYLQQWSYVAPVLEEARAVFRPSDLAIAILDQHIRDTGQGGLPLFDAISLHVRRGDNTNPETHPIGTWPLVTMDYYRAALDVIGSGPVLVFSEDEAWTEANMTPVLADAGRSEFHFVKPGPVRAPDYFPAEYAADDPLDWIDLQLMAACRAHINANSTYSLWAAVIGGGPTTYPDNWVGFLCRSAVPDESTICPPDWTMIHNPVAAHELFEEAAPC